MSERLWGEGAARPAPEAIVANGGGSGQALFEVAALQDSPLSIAPVGPDIFGVGQNPGYEFRTPVDRKPLTLSYIPIGRVLEKQVPLGFKQRQGVFSEEKHQKKRQQ